MQTENGHQLIQEMKNNQALIQEYWTSYEDLAQFLEKHGFCGRFFGLRDLTGYIKQTVSGDPTFHSALNGWKKTEKMLRYFREEGKPFRKWLEKNDLNLIERVTGKGWRLYPDFRDRLQTFKTLAEQVVRVKTIQRSSNWGCAYRAVFQTGVVGARPEKSIYFDRLLNPSVYEVLLAGAPVATVILEWLHANGRVEVNRKILDSILKQSMPRLNELKKSAMG
ncbi:hypothetical protein LLE49_09870 [Alicyclobacillus tolerans]|uniref:hypothetical protein n=1 Tax=Alicyclobacillus tolerans TaxID=90970 RepID=UPI001F1A7EA1|nr:hypothetical protein [Alicyclobacillus tolerans]MCF8565022.1 hypothetical protein [Alicyclobacillus tolerans]